MALVNGGFSGVITRQIGVGAGMGHAGAPAQPDIHTGLTPWTHVPVAHAGSVRRPLKLCSEQVA